MELLVIFIIVSVLDKIFKTKKDQKNIREARKRRMETLSPENKSFSQGQSQSQRQNTIQTNTQKPKSLAEKIKEEIEKGYGELERNIKSPESRKIDEKPIMEKTKDIKEKRKYLTDYDRPYETYNGKGSLEGKEYKGGKYITDYEKPYETYGRKTGTQEGRSYKKRDEDFYKRREKKIPIMDKKSSISIQDQILTGIIYSEILSKPKCKR